MTRQPSWRVRVRRSVEDWVSVEAQNQMQAEAEAAKVPGVIMVFGSSAIRADFVPETARPEGVRED